MRIVTHSAMYVKGDYNATNWNPAALIADVASFLSNSWTDAASTTFPRPRTFATTTENAASHRAT